MNFTTTGRPARQTKKGRAAAARTINRWIARGATKPSDTNASNRALTDVEELQLAGWIREKATQDSPCDSNQLRAKIRKMLQLRQCQV